MSRKLRVAPFNFQQVYNFYDEVYPCRGSDDLWIDTVHLMMQCQVNINMAKWILGIDKMTYQQLGAILGVYNRADLTTGIRYSDAYGYENRIKAANKRRIKLVAPLTTMNEILAWAFEVYILPHPKMYLSGHPPAKKVWGQITQEYSEVIKRNGGKPNKETYTRPSLFPIEIMEWGWEGIRGSRSKEHLAERESKRVDAIRKYRAAHGEEHFLLS